MIMEGFILILSLLDYIAKLIVVSGSGYAGCGRGRGRGRGRGQGSCTMNTHSHRVGGVKSDKGDMCRLTQQGNGKLIVALMKCIRACILSYLHLIYLSYNSITHSCRCLNLKIYGNRFSCRQRMDKH